MRLDDTGEKLAKVDFIMRNSGMLYVSVDGGSTDIFQGSLGMIVDWETGEMKSRDKECRKSSTFARETRSFERLPKLSAGPGTKTRTIVF